MSQILYTETQILENKFARALRYLILVLFVYLAYLSFTKYNFHFINSFNCLILFLFTGKRKIVLSDSAIAIKYSPLQVKFYEINLEDIEKVYEDKSSYPNHIGNLAFYLNKNSLLHIELKNGKKRYISINEDSELLKHLTNKNIFVY
jgi:hypothetical protein